MSSAAEVRQRRRAGSRPETPTGPTGPRSDLALSFALRFEAGQGVLALVRAPGEGLARVDLLELGIPDLRFPFDVTGGAARFQSHRLLLRRALVRVDLDALGHFLETRLSPVGVVGLDLGPAGVFVTLRDGGAVAFRVLVEPAGDARSTMPVGRDLRFRLTDARAIGPVGMAASLAAARVAVGALRAVGTSIHADESGLVLTDPLRALLKDLLCAHGWRLPAGGTARLRGLAFEPGRATLSFSSVDGAATDELGAAATVMGAALGVDPAGERATLEALEGLRLARTADARLREGDLAGAREALLRALAQDPDEPTLLLRLGELDAGVAARAENALAIAGELRDREGLVGACARAIEAVARESLGEPLVAATALEGLADVDPDPRVRSAALLHAARLTEALRPERAFGLLSRVDRLRPADPEPAGRLFELALSLGRRADAERIFPRTLASADTAGARARLLTRFGDALLSRWDDPSAARGNLERALRLDPSSADALSSLATVTARLSQPARAVRILARLADVRADAGDRPAAAGAHLAAAELFATALGDLGHAAARAREATAFDPRLASAQLLLGRLSARLSRAEESVFALERYLELAGESSVSSQVDALVLLARVHLEQRGDREAGLEAARRALALGPSDPRALRAVEEALFLLRDFQRLAEHHDAAAEREPTRAVFHLRELARLRDEHLDDPLAALDAVRRATELAPHDRSAHEELARLAERLGQPALLRRALERLAELRTEPDARAEVLARLAELLLAVADVRGATAALSAASTLAPDEPVIAARLVDVRRRIGEPVALAEALMRLADVQQARGSMSLVHDLRIEAARAFSRAGRLREAGDALRSSVAALSTVDADSAPTADARWASSMLLLAEVEERRGAYPEARVAYGALRNAGVAATRTVLAEARVAEHLGDDAGAAALYEGLLGAPETLEVDRALEHLVALHRRRDEPRRVAEVLEHAAAMSQDVARASELLHDAARVRSERLGDAAGAERILWTLAAMPAPHPPGLRLLAALVEARGDHAALARVYEHLARLGVPTPEAREAHLDVLQALAALYAGPLHDEERARRAWEMLLAEDPDDDVTRMSLAQAALRRRETDVAQEHYARLAVSASSPARRAEAAWQMGLLRREAGDPHGAERHLRAAWEGGHDPHVVLPLLEDLYTRMDRPEDQAKVLEAHLRAGGPEDAQAALRRLARLYEGPLEDPAAAARAIMRLAATGTDDPGIWRWLARVCQAGGDDAGRVDALRRAAASTLEGPDAAELLTEAARTLGPDGADADVATAILHEALERDPGSLPAARALDVRLLARQDHGARARLFARVATAAAAPAARADALLARAAVLFEALDDPRGALEDALAAAPERPTESAILAARIARSIGDPAAEVAALVAWLGAPGQHADVSVRAARLRLAFLFGERLGAPMRAAAELRAVLVDDPSDAEAAEALTAILRAVDDPEALAEHLLIRADHSGNGPALVEEAARALGSAAARAAHAGNADAAIALLERSWAVSADDDVAETLDHLYAESGQLGPRRALLERRASGQEPAAQRALIGRLAGLLPEAEATQLDERLAALGDGDAVSRLVDRLRLSGDRSGVVTLLARAAMAAPAGPARIAALLAVADAAEEAGDDEAREDSLREAVLEDPSAEVPTDRLAAFRVGQGDLAGAVALLARAEELTDADDRKVRLLSRRAALHARTGDDDAAIDALARAMALAPDDPDLQGDLEAAYRRAGRWHELVALLAARAEELPAGSARAELEMEVSLLLEEHLRDPLAAARMALRASAAHANREVAAEAASRAATLARAGGEPALEAEALARLATASPDDARAADALVTRADRLLRSGESMAAASSLRDALARRPYHPGALFALGTLDHDEGRLHDACERLEAFGAIDGTSRDDRLIAARLVARSAETLGEADRARRALARWAELAPDDPTPHAIRASLELDLGDAAAALVSLDALVDRARDDSERFHALVDRARLWRDSLDEPRRAAKDYLAAAELEPSLGSGADAPMLDGEIGELALALAIESESWQDAARAAGLLLDRIQDPERRRELHEMRARLRAQRLSDYPGATDDLLTAIRLDARSADEGLLTSLVDAALTGGRLDAACEALDALVALPPGDPSRPALCVRVAEAAEKAGRTARAKQDYRNALSLGAADPSRIAARLARLLDPDDEREELRSILELQLATGAQAAEDPELRASVLRRLAILCLDAHEDASAERHLRALAAIAPSDPLAFGNLRRIFQRRGAWAPLLELLRSRLEQPGDRSERVAVFYEIGKLLHDNLGREAEAAEAYRDALSSDPEHLPSLDALADLSFRRADLPTAEALYARLGDRGTLPLDALLVRRAEIAGRLGKTSEAALHYRAALAANPRNAHASEALARQLVQAGSLEEAIVELGRAVELCGNGEEERCAELRVLLGQALLDAGRPADAETPLREAAAVLEGVAQPLLLLRDVYTRTERWRDLVDVFSRLQYLVTTPRARAELEFRMGEVHRLRLGDDDTAADHYARGYDLDPRHLPTLRRLVVRYGETGRHRDALDVFNELLRLDAALARRPDVLWWAACAAALLADTTLVDGALAVAVAEAPDDFTLQLAVARLTASSDPTRAHEALGRARLAGAGADALGRLASELSGDDGASEVALAAARAALSLQPADAGALAALAEQAERSGDEEAAARARAVLAFVDPDAPRRIPLQPRPLGGFDRDTLVEAPSSSPVATAIKHAGLAFRPSSSEPTVPGTPITDDAPPEIQEPLSHAHLLVGGTDLELYLLDGNAATLGLLGGDIPRLLFGGGFTTLPEPERLFLVTRALLRLSTGEGLLERVEPAEVLSRLRSLRRALVGARIEDAVRESLERSAASMSARDRILVAQALDRGLEGATPEIVAEVIEELRLYAGRSALSATRDVTAALSALARSENGGVLPEGPLERAQIARDSVALQDLVAFALTTPL